MLVAQPGAAPGGTQLRRERLHLGFRLLAAEGSSSSLAPGSCALPLRPLRGRPPRGRLRLGLQDAGLRQLARLTELHHLAGSSFGPGFQRRHPLHRRAQGGLQLSHLVTLVCLSATPVRPAVSLLRACDSRCQGLGVVSKTLVRLGAHRLHLRHPVVRLAQLCCQGCAVRA